MVDSDLALLGLTDRADWAGFTASQRNLDNRVEAANLGTESAVDAQAPVDVGLTVDDEYRFYASG